MGSRGCLPRRGILKLGVTMAVSPTAGPARAGVEAAASALPQAGDLFAFSDGDRKGEIVRPADLSPADPPLLVWPMEPHRAIMRDRSRLNQVLLLRLGPARPGDDRIVAFSAICTHAGCAVSQWKARERHFLCPCHLSEYDPQNEAAVVAGPAPRPLPALPVAVTGGALRVASGFTARIGGGTGRTD
jgi:rieske iron-sulfur protein